VRQAQANYDALKKGASEEDIAAAQAALDQAMANLEQVRKGATPEDIQAAQAKVDEAKSTRDQVAATTSNAKEQARLDLVQASNALQNVQDIYGKIKDENDQQKPEDLTDDDKNREAKALRDVKDAEARVDQAALNYETAKKNEIAQLAQSDANIQAAQAALDKLNAGPTAEEISIAQAGVDSAKAKLDSLTAGPEPEELAAAQAQVDQAQAGLDQLKAGGTQAEIDAAQADVDKAQAALDKLKAGPTAEDIRVAEEELAQARANLDKVKAGATPEEMQQAQAQVDAAQAALDKLRAGPTRTDLAILEQGIVLSQISVDAANSELDNAKLTTPIAGTVLTIDLEVGETVGGYQRVADVADLNSLRVKADIDELDVGRVSVGQAVTVTLDAYPGVKLHGTIEKLAPGATQKQGSTVYQATIDFTGAEGVVSREGMAASVDVTAQRKDDVLLVPNRAIETVGDRHYVTIQEGDTTRKVEIETGLSNNADTEVISGLGEGQIVVIR
jgi:HlyD family secretion protein